MARFPLGVVSTLAIVLLPALGAVTPGALAGWSADPVEVRATTNQCPQVAACEDAGNGAIVAWEEADGPLRAAHLLPSGDLDPAWPPFVVASTMGPGRVALRAIADGAGGAYFTWIANDSLFLQRVTADGGIPAPWPDRGRSVRRLLGGPLRPTVIPDGAGGLYVSWLQHRLVFVGVNALNLPTFFLDRRGPDGLLRAGWPAGGRAIGVDPYELELVASCAVAPAPGGGVWAAWANTRHLDPFESGFAQLPGAVRLLRLTPAGQPASGWGPQGVALASYPADSIAQAEQWGWWTVPRAAQVAVANDGGEGVFVARGLGLDDYSGALVFAPRLHRLDASGATVAGWPEAGLAIFSYDIGAYADFGPDGSLFLQAGSRGDAYLGHATYFHTDSPPQQFFTHVGADRGQSVAFAASRVGWEVSRAGDGAFVLAEFYPRGSYGYADDHAHIACRRSNGPAFSEAQSGPPIPWYGDVGVTGLRDGGAIFAWSQHNQRYGVFAVRLNPAGLVTGVPPPAPAPRLALRFAPGAGVRASASFASAGETRFLLADVTGRAVARETFGAAAGDREWTIPGTAALPPGLYFARLAQETGTLTARVVVMR